VIAVRPAETPHASLIRRVPTAAQVGRWHPEVVATVARILRNESLLTDAEAEWLEMAGPAWMEDEEDLTELLGLTPWMGYLPLRLARTLRSGATTISAGNGGCSSSSTSCSGLGTRSRGRPHGAGDVVVRSAQLDPGPNGAQ
jgi:hypothetical protein